MATRKTEAKKVSAEGAARPRKAKKTAGGKSAAAAGMSDRDRARLKAWRDKKKAEDPEGLRARTNAGQRRRMERQREMAAFGEACLELVLAFNRVVRLVDGAALARSEGSGK